MSKLVRPVSALVAVALAAMGPLSARAGFEATGAAAPPPSDDPLDPHLGWRASRPAAGTIVLAASIEAASDALVRTTLDPLTGEIGSREAVLTDLGGIVLGGRYAISDRVELAATAPVWLSATVRGEPGSGLGDLGLHLPIQLGGGALGSGGWAASVVPSATLPTGAAARYLGDPGPSLAAQLVGEASAGPVLAAAWGGLGWRTFRAEDNVRPGFGALGGASVGARIGGRLGVHLGWRATGRLAAAPPDAALVGAPRRPTGSELALSTRARLGSGGFVTLGVASATQAGPGAASLRLWIGAGVRLGRSEAAPVAADGPAPLRVVDERGEPVAGALVAVGGAEVGISDADGRLAIPAKRWRRTDRLEVSAPGFVVASIPPPGPEGAEIALAWRAISVTARARDEEGRPIPAVFDVDGASGEPVGSGEARFALRPGRWVVAASAPGFGRQERDLALDVGGPSAEEVAFILLPAAGDGALDLAVIDVDGVPVPAAAIGLDGRPVGQSASGGRVRVEGLPSAPLAIDVRADTFRDGRVASVLPGADADVEIVLARERGAVQVVVRGPTGQRVEDASARFLGADRLGPFALGEAGSRTFVLRPGSWQLLVASPRYGLQQRALEIRERDEGLHVVEIVLQPPEDGVVDLGIRVVDPDNLPVPGASVVLDGRPYGATGSGGEVRLTGLREGPRRLEIGGERLVAVEQSFLLHAGLQERTVVVPWRVGTTLVLARTREEGLVPDAVARFAGPTRPPPASLGSAGFRFFELAPGAWQVLVASPSAGARQQPLAIPEGSGSLHVVDALLDPVASTGVEVAVDVVGPEGDPIRGAVVSFDGVHRGATTTGGGLLVGGVGPGLHRIEVAATPYASRSVDLRVVRSDARVSVPLAWGVGALRVAVRADGRPVPDATVRLGGPRFVPASPVDGDGQRLFAVEPGQWQILVSSPSTGIEQRRIAVPAEPGLTEVRVDLGQPVAGLAQVLVRVQDEDGGPVRGAVVRVDGAEPALTGEGGLALLAGLTPGTYEIAVEAARFEGASSPPARLDAGPNERIVALRWVTRPITVRVEGPDGAPLRGAEVRFDGPADEPAARTSAEGVAVGSLRPGRWRVLASADGLGTQAVALVVNPGDPRRDLTLRLQRARAEVEGGAVAIRDTLYFDVGMASLRPENDAILDEIAALLQAHPEIVRLEVEGHTDPIGGVPFNMELSRRRAAAVVAALVARGVAPERLVPRGYGPTRPRATNETPEGRALNRRVELRIEGG